ncbi:hypothetical protein ALC56_05996 [Trachymyrmex septentrionalis]|uniref:Uncharacterized protein n=1 Tax=Trachymyrmex septentrionalis TaxID=34720 RepID=A0A195FGI1_9HYME|nr:hypothetical protein ALC56_05996 [Trachymyrmex septentrionalis]
MRVSHRNPPEQMANTVCSAYLACNLDDMLVHGSDNSFLRWAATRHTRRIAITFKSVYQATSSNCEHVDQSRNGSTWNFDWLFKAQQYKRCKFVRLFTKSLCGISHMCDGFYGSEIDVNGNDDKKKSRIKTDPLNIREREGVRMAAREPYPGSHRIRMFLSLRVKRMDIRSFIIKFKYCTLKTSLDIN